MKHLLLAGAVLVSTTAPVLPVLAQPGAVPTGMTKPVAARPLPYSDRAMFDCSGVPGSLPGKPVTYSARVQFGSKTRTVKLALLPCWIRQTSPTAAVQVAFARRLSGIPAGYSTTGYDLHTAFTKTLKTGRRTPASFTVKDGRTTLLRGTSAAFSACSAFGVHGMSWEEEIVQTTDVTKLTTFGNGNRSASAQDGLVSADWVGVRYLPADVTQRSALPIRHTVYVKISYCGKTFTSPALPFNLP